MASEKTPRRSRKKTGDGRLKQVWTVFKMTSRMDKSTAPIVLALVFVPLIVALVTTIALRLEWFTITLWAAVALMVGVLAALIVLGRKAEKVAYSELEKSGQPGQVGAIIKSALRRGWIGDEQPVAVNAKTMDTVFRVVGRGGVVLLTDGPAARTRVLAEDEKRRLARVLPNVPITIISVGPDEGQVRLHRVNWSLAKVKPVLTRAEVQAVSKRVSSLAPAMPIPKGIDPNRVRMSHRR